MDRTTVGQPPPGGNPYYLRLLGSPALEVLHGDLAGHAVTPRRLALLALLGSEGTRGVSRDKVIALLWPDRSENAARHSLADIVYRLRRFLGEDVISSDGERVVLSAERVRVDAWEFMAAVARDDPLTAVRLYRGPFLDGFHLPGASQEFEEWVDGKRSRIAQEFATALESLAARAETEGEFVQAVKCWRALMRHDPANSRIALRLMRALAEAGDAANAVQFADEHERYLRSELDLDVPAEIRHFVSTLRTAPDPAGAAGPWSTPGGLDDTDDSERTLATGSRLAQAERRKSRGRSAAVIAALCLGFVALGYAAVQFLGVGLGTEGDIPEIRSLAVLPLHNLSGNPDEEYFSDGMTEALIGELGRIGALETVISRTTAMYYKDAARPLPDIARELNVDAVVEGSVLRAGDDVRITLQLVNGTSDRQLWSDEYIGSFHDVIPLQRRVSRAVAQRIRLRLSPAEIERLAEAAHSPDPLAYEAYLKGRHHLNLWGMADARRAVRQYEDAISLDSTFAPAYAALAEVCVLLPALNVASSSLGDCKRIAHKAIELDEGLSDAHAALALAVNSDWDWKGAEAEFRRAIELNPNAVMAHLWYGWFLAQVMRPDEALREARRAEELDPRNLFVKTLVAQPLMNLHRYDEALTQLDDVLSVDPEYDAAHIYRSALYNLKDMPDEALESALRAGRRLGEDAPQVVTLIAWSHALAGNERLALEGIARVEELYGTAESTGLVATVYVALGRERDALAALERGYEARERWLPNVTSFPHLDDLRDHPRFQSIRRGMGLPGRPTGF